LIQDSNYAGTLRDAAMGTDCTGAYTCLSGTVLCNTQKTKRTAGTTNIPACLRTALQTTPARSAGAPRAPHPTQWICVCKPGQ